MTPDLAHRWEPVTTTTSRCAACGTMGAAFHPELLAVCPARLAAWEAGVREDAARVERERIAGVLEARATEARDDAWLDRVDVYALALDEAASDLRADTLGREPDAQGSGREGGGDG
jgi:hypothetical protein